MKHNNVPELVAALACDSAELAAKINTVTGKGVMAINMLEAIRAARVLDIEKAKLVYGQDKDVNLDVGKVFYKTPKQAITPRQAQLYHALMLKFTEVGEMFEALALNVCMGEELNIDNLIEELGDDEFGTQMIRQELQLEEAEIKQALLDKLNKRQPTGKFDKDAAIKRADKQ